MLAGILFSTLLGYWLTVPVYGDVQRAFAIDKPASASLPTQFDTYDAGLFSPLEDLNLLSTSDFTTLSHPAFPKYGVRIKKSHFCDGNVRYALSANAFVV